MDIVLFPSSSDTYCKPLQATKASVLVNLTQNWTPCPDVIAKMGPPAPQDTSSGMEPWGYKSLKGWTPYVTKVESDYLPKKGKKNKEMTFLLFSFVIKAFVVATKKR